MDRDGRTGGTEALQASDLTCAEADAPRTAQATLPRIDAQWVTAIEPLPTGGTYELDWDKPV